MFLSIMPSAFGISLPREVLQCDVGVVYLHGTNPEMQLNTGNSLKTFPGNNNL